VPFGHQEQGMSAAPDAGIAIGSGQLAQLLVLRAQVP
jgi:hypothetical protein